MRREKAKLYPRIRHCEERSDEAIHSFVVPCHGLLRFARNDGDRPQHTTRPLAQCPAILRPHSSPPATPMVYGTFNSAAYSYASSARTGLKRSGRAMLERSIADEVEAAIKAGSTEKHLDTRKRVTDLFLVSADGYSGEQIELFGDVLERLIKTVELRALVDISARIALAEMSTQLASIKQAPPAVVRRLAHNDEISIARPVLTESARLTAEDLVELAQTKGE